MLSVTVRGKTKSGRKIDMYYECMYYMVIIKHPQVEDSPANEVGSSPVLDYKRGDINRGRSSKQEKIPELQGLQGHRDIVTSPCTTVPGVFVLAG